MTEQEPTQNEHGDEVHPAFAMINVNRVSSSGGGVSLFDSEVRHQHFVTLRISAASRKRDLSRDWIHGESAPFIEIAMSEAQWASVVSSLNSQGTPVTRTWDKSEGGHLPDIPFSPRLAISIDETRDAAKRMFTNAKEALARVEERPTKANIRALRIALEGAEPNVTYAARTLAEHAENTVQKAKADVEAMIDYRARQLGLDPHTISLEVAGPKELEQ